MPLEAKVRVVKCPKCEKLLPELPNFTVYKCGGCNATLQAQGSFFLFNLLVFIFTRRIERVYSGFCVDYYEKVDLFGVVCVLVI